MEEMNCRLCNKKITKANYSGIAYVCSTCVSEINNLNPDNYDLQSEDEIEDISEKEKSEEYNELELKEPLADKKEELNYKLSDKSKVIIKEIILSVNLILCFLIFASLFFLGSDKDSDKNLGYLMFFGGIIVVSVLVIISSRIVTKDDGIEKVNAEEQMEKDKEYVRQIKAQNPDADICPFCMSTHVTVGTRGYRVTTGFAGSSNTEFRCLNCGHNYGFNDTLWIRAIR